MRFGENTKIAYFSVNYTIEIGQMRCVPQVCYKMGNDIRGAVEGLAEKGMARIYPQEVRFISGNAVPMKKPESKLSGAFSSSAAQSTVSQTGRRGGKAAGKGRKDFE
jgi:hypothetical protein